ncbi:PilN domain-containing protein [Roseateles koreensis]|uniref:PilN domain-containing protein n=1 Tax=Roseateles koreensis TaxID=2987526 RepID=A0ABT5KNI1_9BURK|nr:PilN domain-containing protein [Roseateles koreensis]MDC8784449.1 PilN domain-containing protein [Roseateles koreensis]
MAQQINLLTPILLAPKRYFSTVAMLQALGLLLLAVGGLCLWMTWQGRQARNDFAQAQARGATELQTLTQALTTLPAPLDPKQMAQQLSQLDSTNQDLLLTLTILRGGLAPEGWRHSDLLTALAQTVPGQVWLGSLRWAPGHLSLTGATLDPSELRTWLERLAGKPLLAGLQLATVKIEKWSEDGPPPSEQTNDPNGATPSSWRVTSTPKPRPGLSVWSFRVVSELPPGANSAALGLNMPLLGGLPASVGPAMPAPNAALGNTPNAKSPATRGAP